MIVYWLQFPPHAGDNVDVLTNEEYWAELPPNCHYERVEVEQELPHHMSQDKARELVETNGKA